MKSLVVNHHLTLHSNSTRFFISDICFNATKSLTDLAQLAELGLVRCGNLSPM